MGQLDNEGREFIKELFYGLDTNISQIQTAKLLSEKTEDFYNISYSGILGSTTLFANAKDNPFFNVYEHQKKYESSIELLQWYNSETKKSKAKRLVIWCTDYSVFYSLRNLFSSISWAEMKLNPEPDEIEKETVEIGFWDNEETAMNDVGPYLILKIFQPNFGSNCRADSFYKYVIWITLDEEYLTK